MPWLWFAAPLTFIFLAVIYSLWPTLEERRLRRELQRWLDEMLGPLVRRGKKQSRRARDLPAEFRGLLDDIGGGSRIGDVVLVPKAAYVTVRAADHLTAANHISVICRLAKEAPAFVCRPVPIVDGRPAPNVGVHFKHAAFMESFLVEGDDEVAIRKWLKASHRQALLDMETPDAWLRVRGRNMALTLYGKADADEIDELVATADALYAERGAGGGEPLLVEPSAKQAVAKRSGAKEGDDEDDVEEEKESGEPALGRRIAAGAIDLGLYGLGIFFLAALLGRFDSFHPAVFFNSPDLVIDEAWQGGWTTKGFGAVVSVESFLLGILCWQAYLGARSGQSLGKLFLGLKTVRTDGSPPGFWRGVALRKWLLAIIPLLVTVAWTAAAGPFTARAFFSNVPTRITVYALAAVGVAALGMLVATGRGLHDWIAGTKVVTCEPYALQPVEIGERGMNPAVFRRLVGGVVVLLVFVVINVVMFRRFDAWLLEVHQWI